MLKANKTYVYFPYSMIHPTWKPLRWQREMKSKLTCSWYHSIAVGRGRFKSLLFKYGKTSSQACRFCDIEDETEDHIFFRCPEHRQILQTIHVRHLIMNLIWRIYLHDPNYKDQWNPFYMRHLTVTRMIRIFFFDLLDTWFLVSFTYERLWQKVSKSKKNECWQSAQ